LCSINFTKIDKMGEGWGFFIWVRIKEWKFKERKYWLKKRLKWKIFLPLPRKKLNKEHREDF